MAELAVRFILAGGALLLAWGSPNVSLAFGAQAAAIFASAGLVFFLLEKRGFRTPSVSAIIALLDAFFISTLLAKAGQMDRFGAACAIPVMWACIRHQASPALAGPMSAGSMMAAQNLFGIVGVTWPAAVNAGIVATIGLLAQQSQKVLTITRVEEPEMASYPAPQPELPDDYLELRENFRQLRDHASQLERRSRKDRLSVSVLHATTGTRDTGYANFAKKVMEVSGASGLSVYTVSQFGERMVVQSASGDVPDQLHTASFETPMRMGENQIRTRIDKLIQTLRSSDSANGSIILKARGKVIGMVCLFAKSYEALNESRDRVEEAADTLGLILKSIIDQEEEIRRLREAELLYTVSCTASGSDTPTTLSQRVLRELNEFIPLDHLSIWSLDGFDTNSLARIGSDIKIFDNLSFGAGPGIAGWIGSGAPEMALHDAKSDQRLEGREAVKKRIGSLMILPILTGSKTGAILVAMSHRIHGLDSGHLETLRIVSSELGQAFARLDQGAKPAEGLATPKELFSAVQKAGEGCLVYMEIPMREELAETYGRAALSHATAKFAQRIRAKLPAGGLLCRRDEGDYVAFLREMDEASAMSWANDAAATASMIGLTTPDGRAKIPLALKAKTALIDRNFATSKPEKQTV